MNNFYKFLKQQKCLILLVLVLQKSCDKRLKLEILLNIILAIFNLISLKILNL